MITPATTVNGSSRVAAGVDSSRLRPNSDRSHSPIAVRVLVVHSACPFDVRGVVELTDCEQGKIVGELLASNRE
jgi:hypothetical protein